MTNKKIHAVKFTQGNPELSREFLTEEAALQIKINGKAYTITMRTPSKDRELAVGLLLTEGIITSYNDILSITETAAATGNHTLIIDVAVEEKLLEGKNLFNRSIASSASCGVCGKIELCDLVSPEHAFTNTKKLDVNILPELFDEMKKHQENFVSTGGCHAASIHTLHGKMLSVKEDIGRHNAVDKAIGELLIDDNLSDASIMCVSGRVSYEIVAKCSMAGIPFLVAVSAPSSMAVEFCQRKGITLLAFCRGNKVTAYSHPENIIQYSALDSSVEGEYQFTGSNTF